MKESPVYINFIDFKVTASYNKFKVRLPLTKRVGFIFCNENPVKTMKNSFNFTLKAVN